MATHNQDFMYYKFKIIDIKKKRDRKCYEKDIYLTNFARRCFYVTNFIKLFIIQIHIPYNIFMAIIVKLSQNEIATKLYQRRIIYFDARIERTSETAFTDRNPIKLLRFKFSSALETEKLSVRIYRNTIRIHNVE